MGAIRSDVPGSRRAQRGMDRKNPLRLIQIKASPPPQADPQDQEGGKP